MSTNRYIDKLKARLAKEADTRMRLQELLDDQIARNSALLAERDALRDALEHCVDSLGSEYALPHECVKQARAALQGEQP